MAGEIVAVLCPWYDGGSSVTRKLVEILESRYGLRATLREGLSRIDHLRSEMANEALHAGATAILWVDGDTIFEAEDAARLLGSCMQSGADVMAAVVPSMGEGGRPNVCFTDPVVKLGVTGGVYNAELCGFGLTVTMRSAFRKVESSVPDVNFLRSRLRGHAYFLPEVVDLQYRGEDHSFCGRLRRAGGRIVADTRIRVGHLGPCGRVWRWEDMGTLGGYSGPNLDEIVLNVDSMKLDNQKFEEVFP